jgi:hypothetical protein
MLKQKKKTIKPKAVNNPPRRRGGFGLYAKLKLWRSRNGRSEARAIVISVFKSPLTPLYQRGELVGINSKTSPFRKRGIEGDFYLDFALSKQVSHFPSARIIYSIPSAQRNGFTSTKHYLANIPAKQQKII